MSAQYSLFWRIPSRFQSLFPPAANRLTNLKVKGPHCAHNDFVAFASRADHCSERTPTLKGELRIRRDQQETPHALQEAEFCSWHRFGEAYSALRDWRPISGRSSLPIRLTMFRERRSFQLRTTSLIAMPRYCLGKNPPTKDRV